jgi:hypothetical protein
MARYAAPVTKVHLYLGIAVLASNGLAAAWGAIAWTRRDPSTIFWYLLRAAQVIVVVQVVAGVVLLAGGKKPPDSLHYIYGIAPLVISLVCEAARVGIAQSELEAAGDIDALERREQILLARRVVLREMGTMTIGAILIVTLALRAASTGGGL